MPPLRLRGSRASFVKSIANHWVQIGEKQQRNLERVRTLAAISKTLRQRGSCGQRAVPRLLNHRAVGDRIGERHAQFDQVRAASFERRDQIGV